MPATSERAEQGTGLVERLVHAEAAAAADVGAATASSTDFAGLRTALPVRSSSTMAEPQTSPAAPSAGASAIRGTQTAVRA